LGEEASKSYTTDGQNKRKHRRTHGMVGFAEMARLISDKWKNMSPAEKQPFEQEAHQESLRYQEAILKWKKDYQHALLKWTFEKKKKHSKGKQASETSPTCEEEGDDDDVDDDSEEGTRDDEVAYAQENDESGGSHEGRRAAPVSPRSEAAALLVSIPMATHASAAATHQSGRACGAAEVTPMDSSSSLQEAYSVGFVRPRCFQDSGPPFAASNLKTDYPNLPLALVQSSHMPVPRHDGDSYSRIATATSSAPNPDRVRRLEELYRCDENLLVLFWPCFQFAHFIV
jgi:HMG-box domain